MSAVGKAQADTSHQNAGYIRAGITCFAKIMKINEACCTSWIQFPVITSTGKGRDWQNEAYSRIHNKQTYLFSFPVDILNHFLRAASVCSSVPPSSALFAFKCFGAHQQASAPTVPAWICCRTCTSTNPFFCIRKKPQFQVRISFQYYDTTLKEPWSNIMRY